MLGSPKLRHLDEPIAISLEDLVPQDHFYRHLQAKLDLAIFRDWTRDHYAERGRPRIDPTDEVDLDPTVRAAPVTGGYFQRPEPFCRLSTKLDASCYRDAARAGFHPRRIVSRMVSYFLPSSRAALIAGTKTSS